MRLVLPLQFARCRDRIGRDRGLTTHTKPSKIQRQDPQDHRSGSGFSWFQLANQNSSPQVKAHTPRTIPWHRTDAEIRRQLLLGFTVETKALILAATATDVLVDPALPLGHQFLGFLVPVPVGRPPGLNDVGAAVGEAAYPVGKILAVGACGDLVGGACPVVVAGTRRMTCRLSGSSACSWSPSAIRSYR
jgi:hypothetical protein